MATVRELKEYLGTLPDDTEIFVVETRTHGWDTYSTFVNLNLHRYEGNSEFSDYNNQPRLYLGDD